MNSFYNLTDRPVVSCVIVLFYKLDIPDIDFPLVVLLEIWNN